MVFCFYGFIWGFAWGSFRGGGSCSLIQPFFQPFYPVSYRDILSGVPNIFFFTASLGFHARFFLVSFRVSLRFRFGFHGRFHLRFPLGFFKVSVWFSLRISFKVTFGVSGRVSFQVFDFSVKQIKLEFIFNFLQVLISSQFFLTISKRSSRFDLGCHVEFLFSFV